MPRSDRLRLPRRAAPPLDRLPGRLSVDVGLTICRLVDRGDPDVMAVLWPRGDITWMVALVTGEPTTRLLSVKSGPLGQAGGELLSLSYDVRDPDDERLAWRALGAGLRSGS